MTWKDYGWIRHGRAPDYVQILLSNLFISVDAAVGDVLGDLSTTGKGPYRFSIASNPYFKLAGNVVEVNAALVAGAFPIQITAIGSQGTFTQGFGIRVQETVQPPPPPIIIPPPGPNPFPEYIYVGY